MNIPTCQFCKRELNKIIEIKQFGTEINKYSLISVNDEGTPVYGLDIADVEVSTRRFLCGHCREEMYDGERDYAMEVI